MNIHNIINKVKSNKKNYHKGIIDFINKADKYEKIHLGNFDEVLIMNKVNEKKGDIEQVKPPFMNCYFEVEVDGYDDYGVIVEQKDVNGAFLLTSRMCTINKKDITVVGIDFDVCNKYIAINGRRKTLLKHTSDDGRKVDDSIIKTFFSIISFVLKSFDVIACSNVELIDNVKYSHKKKHGKIRKGLPLYTYKTLHIKPNKTTIKNISKPIGTHASPRLHLRRGHIRKLPSGETTWVQSCMVGTKDNGIVEKEYVVD